VFTLLRGLVFIKRTCVRRNKQVANFWDDVLTADIPRMNETYPHDMGY
jgi:hypothetical protein